MWNQSSEIEILVDLCSTCGGSVCYLCPCIGYLYIFHVHVDYCIYQNNFLVVLRRQHQCRQSARIHSAYIGRCKVDDDRISAKFEIRNRPHIKSLDSNRYATFFQIVLTIAKGHEHRAKTKTNNNQNRKQLPFARDWVNNSPTIRINWVENASYVVRIKANSVCFSLFPLVFYLFSKSIHIFVDFVDVRANAWTGAVRVRTLKRAADPVRPFGNGRTLKYSRYVAEQKRKERKLWIDFWRSRFTVHITQWLEFIHEPRLPTISF